LLLLPLAELLPGAGSGLEQLNLRTRQPPPVQTYHATHRAVDASRLVTAGV
jgi:hypothetical protein